MADIEELRKLEAAATPGPWGTVENWESGDGIFIEAGSHPDSVTVALVYPTYSPEAKPQNAELICALRNAAPAIIAVLTAARKANYSGQIYDQPWIDELLSAVTAFDSLARSALSTEGR